MEDGYYSGCGEKQSIDYTIAEKEVQFGEMILMCRRAAFCKKSFFKWLRRLP
jgi:hypothetical protein